MEQISLAKFLARYYNITNDNLSKITHEDAKKLIPNIKRCSFDYTYKNQDLVAKGKVVLVADKRGKVIPYIIPEYIHQTNENDDIYMKLDSKENEIDISDLSELTTYELVKALKQEKRISILKNIKKELNGRKDKTNKNYKMEREDSRLKEKLNDYMGEKHAKY